MSVPTGAGPIQRRNKDGSVVRYVQLAHNTRELDRMHLVTLATADGHVAQRSATTAGQKTILTAPKLPEPSRFSDFTVPSD